MSNEKLMNETEFDVQEFKDLGLEIAEVSSSTMLEDLGASIGQQSCSSVVIIKG